MNQADRDREKPGEPPLLRLYRAGATLAYALAFRGIEGRNEGSQGDV